MAKRPAPQRDVLVRTLPGGAIEITDARDGAFVVQLPSKHAVDAYVTMNRLRVVTGKPKQEPT